MKEHPKNKRVLLGYLQSFESLERVIIATYYTKFQLPVMEDYDEGDKYADWDEGEGEFYALEGWYEENTNFNDYGSFAIPDDATLVAWTEVPQLPNTGIAK
jgi:hypothetical protein